MSKDQKQTETKSPFSGAVLGLASPKDRLAAYVLDCALLLPFVQLLQSPIKKWTVESFLFYEGEGVTFLGFANAIIFISLFVLYYTLMTWWKGQTLGKMFFKIRVISFNGYIGIFQSLTRSIFIFFEFLLFGIPFLAIGSHAMRRPIHDRVADTLVISDTNPVGFPNKLEKLRAHSLSAALSAFLAIFVLGYILTHFVIGESFETTSLEDCKKQAKQVGSNLEKMVELNLTDEMTDSCLFEKARDQVWQGKDKALAQFALAMALRDEDSEKSFQYMNEICNESPEDQLCDVSQWLKSNRDKGDFPFSKLLTSVEGKKTYNFVRVFVSSILNNEKKYKKAAAVLEPINKAGQLQNMVAALHFHSLLGQLKWEEAQWVFRTHDQVDDDQILYFMQLELKRSQLSVKQQLQLLDFFYPSLNEKSSGGRVPASTDSIPNEIQDIYRILEGRL